ncbi:MAG: hypothetical protein HY904_00420 [Deltaproteobacteria bacterium]|nr:hypothetical protein [Deltaproteobacteria bacterium]
MVLLGTEVPGVGLVLQGFTSGTDACHDDAPLTCTTSAAVDGRLACADDTSTPAVDECEGLLPGELALSTAPQHDGLEVRSTTLVAMARDLATPSSECLAASVLIARLPSLPATGVVGFPAGFLPLGAGAFNRGARTLSLPADVAGAGFHRLQLANGQGHPWHLYVPTTRRTTSIPTPPAELSDDRAARADLQAFLRASGVGLAALEELGGPGMTVLSNLTVAFFTRACLPDYAPRDCTASSECNYGRFAGFTCAEAERVCVNEGLGVWLKTGPCPPTAPEAITAAGRTLSVERHPCVME